MNMDSTAGASARYVPPHLRNRQQSGLRRTISQDNLMKQGLAEIQHGYKVRHTILDTNEAHEAQLDSFRQAAATADQLRSSEDKAVLKSKSLLGQAQVVQSEGDYVGAGNLLAQARLASQNMPKEEQTEAHVRAIQKTEKINRVYQEAANRRPAILDRLQEAEDTHEGRRQQIADHLAYADTHPPTSERLAHTRDAVSIARRPSQKDLLASTLIQHGNALDAARQNGEAVETFNEAEQVATTAKTPKLAEKARQLRIKIESYIQKLGSL